MFGRDGSGGAAQLLDSASELRRLASDPQGTPQPGLAWPGYFPPSFLGVLGDFLLLVFFLEDFCGGVSCAKVTATQPRASERPSINVTSFFMGVPPVQVRLISRLEKRKTDFARAVTCRAFNMASSEGRAGAERGGMGCRISCDSNPANFERKA